MIVWTSALIEEGGGCDKTHCQLMGGRRLSLASALTLIPSTILPYPTITAQSIIRTLGLERAGTVQQAARESTDSGKPRQ